MPTASQIDQLAQTASRRLGGILRLLGLYGSAADRPGSAHDVDFFLVVDAVESCVTLKWPELEAAAAQLKKDPISWISKWESRVSAAYTEVREHLPSQGP